MLEPKEKICKGINKANGVKGCGKLTKFRKFGLCSSCLADFYFETDVGKLLMSKVISKVQKPRLEMQKSFELDKYTKLLKASKINTKTQVHAYIRERDKGKDCISCGVEWNNTFQAGHFYKSETFETLKYNLHNINGQCFRCNNFLDGNFDNYSLNLPNRIGQENYNNLVKLAEKDKHYQKVWNVENLKEVRNLLKQEKSFIIDG